MLQMDRKNDRAKRKQQAPGISTSVSAKVLETGLAGMVFPLKSSPPSPPRLADFPRVSICSLPEYHSKYFLN